MVDVVLSVLAGLIAGVINTLAGSGSIITLALMSFLGLPVDMANGTNRVGLFAQGTSSTYSFWKTKQLKIENDWTLIVVSVIGALIGVLLANWLSPAQFQIAIGWVFVLLFFVLLLKNKLEFKSKISSWKVNSLMFFIGIYAGFIQAGAGVFMLAVLNAITNRSISDLNPLKVVIIFLINVIAIVGYAIAGKIVWEVGLAIGVGQLLGGLIGVKINAFGARIEPYLRVGLLILIAFSALRFLNLYKI